MVRYYFHLRDGTDELLDTDGTEYEDQHELRKVALKAARDILAGDLISTGVVNLAFRIDVENELGQLVYTLPFSDAVSITGER